MWAKVPKTATALQRSIETDSRKEEGALALVICAMCNAPSEVAQEVHPVHVNIIIIVNIITIITVHDVFGAELQSTTPTAACQSPKFPAASTSVRGQPSQTEYSAISLQHIWHPCFLCRRSDSLELTA